MRLNPGTLNRRVDLERDRVTHVAGVEVKTPEVYATVWASVVYLSGNEAWKAHQIDATVNTRVEMRYRTDVQPAHRVAYWIGPTLGGRRVRFEIKSVIPDEVRREFVTLECKG